MSTAEPGRSTSASASLSAATRSFADRDYQIVESRTLPIGRASVRPRRAPLRPSRRGKWPQDLLPVKGRAPQPTLILHLVKGKIVEMVDLSKTPQWARALVAAAVKISK